MTDSAQILPFPSPTSSPLAELQKVFCLITLAGQVRIVSRQEIAELMAGKRHGELNMYKLLDGKIQMKRYLETLPIARNPKLVIDDFMVSPDTLEITDVAFSPLPTPPSTLNYWIAPTIQPAAGDWGPIRDFLLNIICAGDAALFTYLIHFLAHMLQKPEEKPGIMLVLLGGEGIGKGTFFALLKAIWRLTTLLVSDVDHVIGAFNAALERTYVVCMDEAMFSGDRKGMDRLKSMITEPTVTIEQKHQPRRSIESCHRFVAASNHTHFAKVDQDARRFVFFRVSESPKGDFVYWNSLHAAIADTAVVAALMHDLLELDLSNFKVRNKPKTNELMEQKILSLQGFERFYFEVLESGSFPAVTEDRISQPWTESHFVSTVDLMAGWKSHERGGRQFESRQSRYLRQSLERVCPSAKKDRSKVQGFQGRGYCLPSLPVARAEFARAMGGEIDWGD